ASPLPPLISSRGLLAFLSSQSIASWREPVFFVASSARSGSKPISMSMFRSEATIVVGGKWRYLWNVDEDAVTVRKLTVVGALEFDESGLKLRRWGWRIWI